MPDFKPGESEKDFVERCIPVVLADKSAKDSNMAAAMCHSMYKENQKKVREAWNPKQNIHEALIPLSEGNILPDDEINGQKVRSYKAWWPLLKVGPGNKKDKNWYTKKALESAGPLAMSRRKMFFAHAEGNVRPIERDPRDWAASLKEWKIENDILYGLAQAYDPWLKERMYDAPDELATSIEGRGLPGGKKTHEGDEWNLIEEVKWINAFNIVDYAGNAPMGVSLTERDDMPDDQEDKMETVAELKEKVPELYNQIVKEIKEADKAEFDKTISAKDAEIKTLKDGTTMDQKTITDLSESVKKMDVKLDGLEALGKKKERDQKVFAEMGRLPKEAITDKFKELVESAKDEKAALEMIEERAKLFEGKVIGHGKTDPIDPIKALKEREAEVLHSMGQKTAEEIEAAKKK